MERSSLAGTATFMSRSLVWHLTVAPASRHTLPKVRSGPTARVRCLPNTSKGAPHSQRASVTSSGNLSRSRMRVLSNCGSTLVWSAAHDWATITVSRWWYSREEDARYCEPCCHSPGSALLGAGGRTPAWNPLWLVDKPAAVKMKSGLGQFFETTASDF